MQNNCIISYTTLYLIPHENIKHGCVLYLEWTLNVIVYHSTLVDEQQEYESALLVIVRITSDAIFLNSFRK